MRIPRRDFIATLAGAIAAPMLRARAARAQQSGPVRRVAVLIPGFAQTDPEGQARMAAFVDTFAKLGWSSDHNVQLDVRQVVNEPEHVQSAAAELIALTPDVIVVSSNPALAVLQKMTRTISIVFVQVSDPVGTGFVAGLAKPGANITGSRISSRRWAASGWGFSRRPRPP